MKMKPEHLTRLGELVANVRQDIGDERLSIHYAALDGESSVMDRDKRFRWDVFWAIPQAERFELMDELYGYLNDSHIDTALRRYVALPR